MSRPGKEVGHAARRATAQKPLADSFTELIADLVPEGHVYTPSQRARFDALYRELSRIDEDRGL